MSNGNQPASPVVDTYGHSLDVTHSYMQKGSLGLTKREAFAMAAMQNILSQYNPYEQGGFDSSDYELTVKNAVGLADALLKELSK